jgi:transcriptional regulator with XRE-family HTH domain
MPLTSPKQIGARLLELRQEQGLTQDQVHKKSGLTPTQIVDIEKGRRDFRVGTLIVYLKAIGGELSIK